ncbi:RsmD family RNA methyltransferase [Bdellovibrio sp. HCB2-146]|uniref:RsmD family RNA methyltransferase n=1 Tax=Bdellovibrio sp. HCB2-146 TaxID=3394362 RepID=UPI0039BD0853
MSSVNPHFTFQYSQPEEYRFSHDSVFLARRVFELIKVEEVSAIQGLDLCAGSGVIGLDFIFHCQKEWNQAPRSFDFLEIQDVYIPHFEKNLQTLNASTHCQMLVRNYADLLNEHFQGKYNLILSNPPYFRTGQGKLSPSEFKNRCRFFIDSDFPTLIQGIANALAPNGSAYILLRDLEEHGWNPFKEAKQMLSSVCEIQSLADIRGTGLVHIKKA